MSEPRSWVRLPGLFRWSEVCDVFALHAGDDDDWHFVIKPHSVTSDLELLYVVHAAEGAAPAPRPQRVAGARTAVR